jgi:hypothetical protein
VHNKNETQENKKCIENTEDKTGRSLLRNI